MTFRAPSLSTYFISLIIAGTVSGLAWLALGSNENGLPLLIAGLVIGHFFGSFFGENKDRSTDKNATQAGRTATNAPATVTTRPGDDSGNDGEVKSIYVGNIAFNAPRGAVQSLFEEYGKVISVRLMTDRVTRRPRGYGFVEMKSEDALAAIEALNGTEFFERNLRVNEAKQRAPYREE